MKEPEMSEMTKEERAWVRKIQKLLDNPPSDRLGFYAIGDADVGIYDLDKSSDIDRKVNEEGVDLPYCVTYFDADLGNLEFPSLVHSAAG